MKDKLGQKFDEAIGASGELFKITRSALYLSIFGLNSYADTSDNDFNPQFKTTKDEPRLPDMLSPLVSNKSLHRDQHNEKLLASAQSLKQISFISIERNGIEHDFPIRVEFRSSRFAILPFLKKDPVFPVIVISDINGKDQEFPFAVRRNSFGEIENGKFTRKISSFLVEQLKQKALKEGLIANKQSPHVPFLAGP